MAGISDTRLLGKGFKLGGHARRRLHVLHHAVEQPIYGSWMIEELREHGYEISPGPLYPMLHGLTRKGYLKMKQDGPGKRARRYYRITAQGRVVLADSKNKIQELFGEMFSNQK